MGYAFSTIQYAYRQGLRNGFHLGVAHSNADFEKVDFQKKLCIEFRNLGVARATPATPVP